ncbi:hypothetical protein J2S19_002315 [Metabacillus malikii]|uniref:Uncharacterized protein n=1 Tax=Metabacillus malikii TaxID=1504265 RepID=A0ABT9ZFJ5_9BACI|nr:hypothetical protein [Metabacillus malikii]
MGFIGGMKNISLPTLNQNGLHRRDEEQFLFLRSIKMGFISGMKNNFLLC